MPYRSEAQRKWLHANMPKLAAKWDRKYRRSATGKGLPKKKG